MTNSNTPEFHSVNLLAFIYRWRKHLIIISLSAALVSSIASFIITPKYKSTAIIFPTLMNTASRALMEEFSGSQKDHLQFGEEEQVEQTMQVLKSQELRERICEKFDLMHHYGLDPNEPMSATFLKEDFDDMVRFKATEYLSIKIDVMDPDPAMAANIANGIIEMIDSVKGRMTKDRAAAALKISKGEITKLYDEEKFLVDSMEFFRKKGIYEHDLQVEAYAKGYAKAIASNNMSGAKMLEDKMKMFEMYGGTFLVLREKLWAVRERIRILKYKYEQSVVDYDNSLPYKFVVDKAEPAEKKASPIRWLIVVVSTLSAFAATVVVLILIENFSKIKLK